MTSGRDHGESPAGSGHAGVESDPESDGAGFESWLRQAARAPQADARNPLPQPGRVIGGNVLGAARRGHGQIVFISSISGKVASTRSALYSATKFGLRGFSLGLRDDLRAIGVGVTTLFPGFIRDAGLFAMTGVQLPRMAGTRSPEDVAVAVIRAVEQNPAEIDVAAFEQRLGGWLAHHFPDFVARMQRAAGGHKIAARIAVSQRSKR